MFQFHDFGIFRRNNTVTFNALSEGTYADCTLTVTDAVGYASTLSVSSFTVDTSAPTVSTISPADAATAVSAGTTIAITFSEAMNTTTLTSNMSNTSCSGTLQVSSDNFSACVPMASAPSASNSNKTFTIAPSDNLSTATTYKVRVTTGVKDAAVGYTLGSQFETASGFTTKAWTRSGDPLQRTKGREWQWTLTTISM